MVYWFLYKSDGTIYGAPYLGTATEWTNIPTVCAGVLGHVAETDATATDAYNNPTIYRIQNDQLVQVSNFAQLQLEKAQSMQIVQLRTDYMQTLAAGFQATITAGTYTFGWQTADESNLNALQTAVANSYLSYPVQYADVNGNPVSIASASDLTTIEQTAAKFMVAQHQQVLTLIGQVQAITTATPNYLSAVEALVWTPASY